MRNNPSSDRRYNVNGWTFISAALFLLILFNIYPIINSLYLSFQTGKGVVMHFAGLDNIKRLFIDKEFHTALFNTFTFLLFQVPIMIILALIFASMLNNPKIKCKAIFRTAIFIPCVTSLVAYSLLFKSMFSYEGIINTILLNIHIISKPIPWLSDPFWGKITIIIAITWRWTGYNMIFYLAAIQNIDRSIYEAADIDSANGVQKFFHITIPMIKPVIVFTTIMSTIGTLQLFDEPMNLTSGGASSATFMGTLSLSQYIYNLSFKYVPNYGYAALISYVIVILVAILTFIQFKIAGGKND